MRTESRDFFSFAAKPRKSAVVYYFPEREQQRNSSDATNPKAGNKWEIKTYCFLWIHSQSLSLLQRRKSSLETGNKDSSNRRIDYSNIPFLFKLLMVLMSLRCHLLLWDISSSRKNSDVCPKRSLEHFRRRHWLGLFPSPRYFSGSLQPTHA